MGTKFCLANRIFYSDKGMFITNEILQNLESDTNIIKPISTNSSQ